MKLREKNLTYFALILFFSFATIYLLLSSTLVVSFSKLEEREAKKDLSRVMSAVEKKINNLDLLVRDWAFWDDSYKFVMDKNPSYISSNLQEITMKNNKFHLMLYLNNNREMVWGSYYHSDNDTYLPISQELLEEILDYESFVQNDPQQYIKGLVYINSCSMLVSSRPILPSSTFGTPNGTLIIGRLFCQEEILDLANISLVPLQFHEKKDLSSYSEQILQHDHMSLHIFSENLLKGFVVLQDIKGEPFGLLEVDMERSIYQQGQTTLRYLLTTLLIFTLLVVGISWHFLQNSIISRLEVLNRFIGAVDLTQSGSELLTIEGSDEIEDLKFTVNNMLIQLDATQSKVLDTNSFLVALIEHTQLGIVFEDHNRHIIIANQAFCSIFELDACPQELAGFSYPILFNRFNKLFLNSEATIERLEEKVRLGRLALGDQVKLIDGKILEVDYIPIFVQDMPKGHLWQYRDVTDKYKAQEQLVTSLKEKEILLKEVHHRVKNNLQVVSSLLRLQNKAIQNDSFDSIFKDCQNRIHVMSLIHENLYRSADIGEIEVKQYITQLISNLIDSYALHAQQVDIALDVEQLYLDIDSMVDCGLIINELVSNSLKYAFPEGKGSLTLSFKKLADQRLQLMVADDGIGIPIEKDLSSTETLGLQLVYLLASQRLGGQVELVRDGGTKFTITFAPQ